MVHRARICLASALICVLAVIPAGPALAGEWPTGSLHVDLDATRMAGADRYATSVETARSEFPEWAGVAHVIVASGEERCIADVLAAAGLVWAYDAPLLLVESDGVPGVVRQALTEIRSANGTITVTVVGGPVSVTPSCVSQIAAITEGVVEQPWTAGDRYAVAAGIARRVHAVAAETSRTPAREVLIANGSNGAGFVDALPLAAISAQTGAPVLFVTKDTVPNATLSALAALDPVETILAGGTAVVSSGVYKTVGATSRWSGQDRFSTAVAIARQARSRGWLTADGVGIAGTVVDGVTGAGVCGRSGRPMLLTESARLGKTTARYLDEMSQTVTSATVYGGPVAVSEGVLAELRGAPSLPVLVRPTAGGLVGKLANVAVSVGVNTTEVRLYAGSTLLATKPATAYTVVDFGKRAMPADGVALKAVATNPDGGSRAVSAKFKRLSYPAKTSIVIDKSEFRLYWVKDDVLIKRYPVALGREGMETPIAIWKINAKYITDPSSVYGPRKMRLFRRVGSGADVRYVYTAYAIHGTNQEWVIGTKASHGCIRMYNKDVLELYPQVPLGTLVQTRQ